MKVVMSPGTSYPKAVPENRPGPIPEDIAALRSTIHTLGSLNTPHTDRGLHLRTDDLDISMQSGSQEFSKYMIPILCTGV
jgi:hypothetical protein